MTLATIRTTLHDSRFDTNVRLYHCKLSLSNNRPILNTFDEFNFIENVQVTKIQILTIYEIFGNFLHWIENILRSVMTLVECGLLLSHI